MSGVHYMKEVGMHMKGWCTATAIRTWFGPFHLSHLSGGHVWAAHAELSICRWCERAQNRKAVAKKTVATVERCLMPPAMHLSVRKWASVASVASVWPVWAGKRRGRKMKGSKKQRVFRSSLLHLSLFLRTAHLARRGYHTFHSGLISFLFPNLNLFSYHSVFISR